MTRHDGHVPPPVKSRRTAPACKAAGHKAGSRAGGQSHTSRSHAGRSPSSESPCGWPFTYRRLAIGNRRPVACRRSYAGGPRSTSNPHPQSTGHMPRRPSEPLEFSNGRRRDSVNSGRASELASELVDVGRDGGRDGGAASTLTSQAVAVEGWRRGVEGGDLRGRRRRGDCRGGGTRIEHRHCCRPDACTPPIPAPSYPIPAPVCVCVCVCVLRDYP